MKKLRIVLSLAIGLLTPAILQTQAYAQHQIPAYAYKVQTSPGTFTDISDAPGVVKLGTDLSETADLKNMIFMATSESNATPTSKTVASNSASASATTPAFPLGFDFRIGGKPVRYFVVSALGGTYFSDSPLQVPTNAMPSTQANTNCIFAYPYQFTSSASTTTALISANIAKVKPGQAPACYLISGSEGNHVLTVQHDYLLNGKDEWIFQFKFHESSGNVEFIVKQMKADNAIAGKSERRYELGLSLVEAGANYIGGASATTDPLGSINVIAPSSMLRRIAVGQSAAVSKAKGWDSAYIVGSTVSTGRMFIDADHFPEEGRTITILHPSPCPEKAPRLSAEHYSITNETFTESNYTANLSFNTAQIPDAQTLFNSGTILAVLSDQEIPAYTLSNGTLYKKGDKIETAEVLCNQLPKVAYGNYPPLGYKISTPIALSVTGLKKGTTRYIHLYAMSYHCDGSPVYSELCHTITFSTAIDMPKQFAVDGLPTANSVTVNATPADGYGTIIVKSRKSTPPSLSGNLAKGDMIGQDAQVMEILNTAATLSIPLDENERCHLFAYTADLSDPDAPLYAPNALALSVRAAYPGLPGLIEFTGEAYTTLDPRDPNFAKTFRDLPIGWTRETAVAETIRNYAFGLGKPGHDNRLKTALYAQVNGSKTSKTEFDVVTPPIVCDKDRVLVTYNVAMLQSPSAGSSETDVYAIDPNANDEFKIEYKIEEGAWISCASFTGNNLPEMNADGLYPLEGRIEANGLKGKRLSLRYSYKGVTRTHSEGDYSSYNSITSVDIKELRLCNQPTDICQTVSQTTDTEATLTWTDNNSPAASSFSVFYKQADNSTDEYLQLTANAPTAKPEGLQPNTLYSVYVTAHCGEKGESYNSLPASFVTLHSFPYTETMVQDPNITKIINGKPVSVPGPGPLDRGFRTATGTLPTNGTTAASLSFIANPVSNDEAFCPYSTYALLNDAKAIPNALGVREYVKEGWLVSSGIYITNDGLPLKINFKANSAQQIDNEWVKGNLPSKFNKVKLYVLVSKNGDFTRNDVVSTIDVSGETVDGKEYTVDIPAIAGIAYVAFFFNNPDANPARDEAEGQEPPAMLFEIYDLHFETAGYNLTLNVSPENAGTVTGGGIYKTDAPVTVTATANENYAFVAWMDGEDVVSTDASHSFPMPDGNRTYTAKFRSLIHKVVVRIEPDRETGAVAGENDYKEGTEVTLTATPKTGYRFKAWMNGTDELSKENPYIFMMPAEDVTYAAVFEPLYTLTLNETPLNAGTVAGANSYGAGDKVSIEATPNENYAFVAWMDGDQIVSTEAGYTFDMPAEDVKYTAAFRPLLHNLTLNIIPGREAGMTTGGGSHKEGTPVTVKAEAYDGYRFVAWMNGDAELSKDNPYTFTMPNENTTYEAVFEPLYTLSLHATPENAGTVTGNGQYAKGESVTIAATANENYVFVAWMDGDETVSTETDYTFDMPAEPVTYTATFRPTIHNVTVLIKPDREAGTVSGEGMYKENTDVTLTATPKNGYRFKAWMNGDAELSKANPYIFTMPNENTTYEAVFEPLYTLTLDRTPGGSVTGNGQYAKDESVTITATPESDYTFVAWMDGDAELSKDNPYTFTMPAESLTYTAKFEANAPDPETFHVMLNKTPDEAGTVSGEATHKEGESVTITATANENYAFVAWMDGDQVVSTEAGYTFEMPAKDVKYTAKFRSLVHNLTLNIIPGREAGNTNGGGSFKEGTPVTVEATAKEGYRFVAWMNGDAELSKDNPYTFTMPNENTTYEAVFEPLYTLSLHATPENAGTVTGNGQYAKGESVTIAATANENYVFVAWMDGDKTVSTETDYTFDMPAEPVTYTATFRPTIHNVTVLIKPDREAGTVSGEGMYKENTDVTLTATPKNGYRFKAWMNGDAELSKANPYIFTMPNENTTYEAVFEPLYTLTLNETPLNAGTVTGENSYAAGDEVTITATPDEDYAFVAWMDGEDVVSTEASHTFTMPAKDLSYTATFRSLVHDVTLYIVPGREAGMTTGGGSYKEGATVTVKAEAYDGYRFTAWTDGDEIVSTQNPYSFTMPDTDVRYTALFQAIGTEPEMFSLSLTVTPQNAGTVTGGGQYAIGEEVAITATANENFTFVAWMDGDETVSTEANHSFLMPAKNMAYTAVFEAVKPIEPETFDVVLNVTPQNTGTVTGNGRYAAGASVVIKATANEGYKFVAWKDGNQTVSTEASHSFTMPARNVTYTAVFEAVKPIVEPETFDVVLNVTPQNAGTVTGSGRYAAGASVVIKAVANEGYRFVAWMNGNDTVSTETTHTFAMPASNVAYSALFVPHTNNEHLLSTAFDMVAKDGKLHIRNLNGIAVKTVDVYGLSGVRFNRFTLNSRENLVLPVDAERAILIVRITTEQGITVHKVYLH